MHDVKKEVFGLISEEIIHKNMFLCLFLLLYIYLLYRNKIKKKDKQANLKVSMRN